MPMPSVTIRNDQKAYLDRTARQLSERSKTRVTSTDVIQLLLDMCIKDEGIYEPKSSAPIKPETRDIYVAERLGRTQPLTIQELLLRIGSQD